MWKRLELRGTALAAFLAVVVTTAIGPNESAAATFRAADNQVEDYPTVQALAFMDRQIQAKTGGRHRIQIFHSGQLGAETDTIEQNRAGALDLNRVNITPMSGLVPAVNALILPFIFRSVDHLHSVLDGPVGDDILKRFDALGLVGLTFYDSGARSIYNDVRPVKSLADLSGLRIRIQSSELMSDMMTALGAKPVQLPYGQVLPALQLKLVDGAENNWPSYVTTGHFRHARYITLTEHVMAPEVLLMSRRAWDTLTADDQAIFREAANASKLFMRERWRDWETKTRAEAERAGSAIVSEFGRTDFESATRPVRDRYLQNAAIKEIANQIAGVR